MTRGGGVRCSKTFTTQRITKETPQTRCLYRVAGHCIFLFSNFKKCGLLFVNGFLCGDLTIYPHRFCLAKNPPMLTSRDSNPGLTLQHEGALTPWLHHSPTIGTELLQSTAYINLSNAYSKIPCAFLRFLL